MRIGKLTTQKHCKEFVNQPYVKREALSDLQVRGLQLDKISSSRAIWRFRYLSLNKRHRRCITIGEFSALTVSDARQIANKYKYQIANGDDPATRHELVKQVPKLSEFTFSNYLPYIQTYKRSWKCDRGLLQNHVLPAFGHYFMDEITKTDLIRFIASHSRTHKPGSVNRIIILIRYMFNLAIKWAIPCIEQNPSNGIPLFEENNKRERYLTSHEAKQLFLALESSHNSMLKFIVPMLILTGARKMEVLTAKWMDFNLDQRVWRIPLSKSGKHRFVPISDGALALLTQIPRRCEYVFANPKTLKPYRSIFSSWHSARTSVDLGDVRMHDLRHSFASFLINNGRSLYEVQKILGHTQISTTQRYAHLSQDSLISAANQLNHILPSHWLNH